MKRISSFFKTFIGSIIKSNLPLAFTLIADGVLLFLGYRIDSFIILRHYLNENGEIIYEITNSSLMIVIGICFLNVLAIITSVSNRSVSHLMSTKMDDKFGRLEAHMVNYDANTLPFEHLSAIEHEIGTEKSDVSNEIWILTNNFAEKEDNPEGKELRDAIISNLKTGVCYFYIIPPAAESDFKQTCDKLRNGIKVGGNIPNDQFFFYIDKGLDFIPSPYYDIILYIKVGAPNGDRYAETTSKLFYCFSKMTDSEYCYYQEISRDKIGEKEIWEKMMKKAINYDHSIFTSVDLNTKKGG